MNKQPLLVICTCFIFGIVLQELLQVSESFLFIILGFAVILLLLSIFRKISSSIRIYLVVFIWFSVGMLLHAFNSEKKIPEIEGKNHEVLFKLTKKLNSNEKNRRYEIVFQHQNKLIPAVLSVPKEEKVLTFSNYYKAKAFVNMVESPRNSYQFDYAEYLSRKGIFYQLYVREFVGISPREDLTLSEKISQKRFDVLSKIDSSKFSARSREFLKGIILADRTEIDSQTVNDFSKTGLAHILAISGSHIAVIFGLIYFLLAQIFSGSSRRISIIASLGFIWAFAVFIGLGNSVVRSCIMLSVYFIYVLLQRKPDFLHSMALSAIIILTFDTHQIFDVGFQLSFIAVLGIFWLNQPLLKHFPRPQNKVQNFLFNVVTVTFAAQIATLPLVLYYFHQFSFISIVANLVIIPLSEIVIVFSLFMTLLIAFNFNFLIVDKIFDGTTSYFLDLIHWFSSFDQLYFENIPMTLLEVALLLVAIYYLRFLIRRTSLKNMINFATVVMLFLLTRIGFNFYELQNNEVMVHELFKEKSFSVKNNGHVYFWVIQNADKSRLEKFIINPYLTSRRAKKVTVNYLPEDAVSVRYNDKIYVLRE